MLATLLGEPIETLPADLFIPPDALRVFFETFEGPLDLLLYLIRRHHLEVLDIPMARLTEQYLAYIQLMQENRFDLAAEYLLMAALLIEIKSRMLLPRPPTEDALQEEGRDPRAALVRRLLEYEQIRAAAEELDRLPRVDRDFLWAEALFQKEEVIQLPDICTQDLVQAWKQLLSRVRVNQAHLIQKERLSVREKMTYLLKQISGSQLTAFSDLFILEEGLSGLITTFIALLELCKEGLIELYQTEPYHPIYARLKQGTLL